jgi:hypothetical protein
MAQRYDIKFECDYDGQPIDGEAFTRKITLDGKHMELDFCGRHNALFDKAQTKWTDMARVIPATVNGHRPRRSMAHRQHSADIRTWAREHGEKVSDRGRIPAKIVRKYELAEK